MHRHTKRLHELKVKHKMSYKDIAIKTGVQPGTVLIWLMHEGPRVIPFRKLYKLEVHLNGEFRNID